MCQDATLFSLCATMILLKNQNLFWAHEGSISYANIKRVYNNQGLDDIKATSRVTKIQRNNTRKVILFDVLNFPGSAASLRKRRLELATVLPVTFVMLILGYLYWSIFLKKQMTAEGKSSI